MAGSNRKCIPPGVLNRIANFVQLEAAWLTAKYPERSVGPVSATVFEIGKADIRMRLCLILNRNKAVTKKVGNGIGEFKRLHS